MARLVSGRGTRRSIRHKCKTRSASRRDRSEGRTSSVNGPHPRRSALAVGQGIDEHLPVHLMLGNAGDWSLQASACEMSRVKTVGCGSGHILRSRRTIRPLIRQDEQNSHTFLRVIRHHHG